MVQVPQYLAQVSFWLVDLRRKSSLYALKWRRSPTQNQTCAILGWTCANNLAPRIPSQEDMGRKQREAESPPEGIGPYELTFEGHSDGSALYARPT